MCYGVMMLIKCYHIEYNINRLNSIKMPSISHSTHWQRFFFDGMLQVILKMQYVTQLWQ